MLANARFRNRFNHLFEITGNLDQFGFHHLNPPFTLENEILASSPLQVRNITQADRVINKIASSVPIRVSWFTAKLFFSHPRRLSRFNFHLPMFSWSSGLSCRRATLHSQVTDGRGWPGCTLASPRSTPASHRFRCGRLSWRQVAGTQSRHKKKHWTALSVTPAGRKNGAAGNQFAGFGTELAFLFIDRST